MSRASLTQLVDRNVTTLRTNALHVNSDCDIANLLSVGGLAVSSDMFSPVLFTNSLYVASDFVFSGPALSFDTLTVSSDVNADTGNFNVLNTLDFNVSSDISANSGTFNVINTADFNVSSDLSSNSVTTNVGNFVDMNISSDCSSVTVTTRGITATSDVSANSGTFNIINVYDLNCASDASCNSLVANSDVSGHSATFSVVSASSDMSCNSIVVNSDISCNTETANVFTANSDLSVKGFFKVNRLAAGAGISGTAVLSSGSVTIVTSSVKSTSIIVATKNTSSGTTIGVLEVPVASIVDSTSFVINAKTLAGVVDTNDNSTVNWIILGATV